MKRSIYKLHFSIAVTIRCGFELPDTLVLPQNIDYSECIGCLNILNSTRIFDEKHVNTKKIQECPISSEPEREQKGLLSKKISDMALKIPGTHLEKLINELYQEMQNAGISFRPKTYLSDEWGCPQGIPVIGIPFYLADPILCKLEGELTGIEAETDTEIMMSLRHEAGHAFNYAYRLYSKPEWQRLFGQFSKSYQEEYKPIPFSARFVHHIPGWYAQKHPDDDFAETFAVWLTPGSNWKIKYADTPALAKLSYIDRAVSRFGQKQPEVTDDRLDKPVQELTMTLDTWYEANRNFSRTSPKLHHLINEDLQRLLPETEGQPAAEVLQSFNRQLIRDVNHWTGMDRHLLESLSNDLIERVRILNLKIGEDQTTIRIVNVAIFLTTLVMNYQFTGQFIES
jgi:hypothetical protein